MTSRAAPLPSPLAPPSDRADFAEILRLSLAGLLPPAPLAHLLDRLEGAR